MKAADFAETLQIAYSPEKKRGPIASEDRCSIQLSYGRLSRRRGFAKAKPQARRRQYPSGPAGVQGEWSTMRILSCPVVAVLGFAAGFASAGFLKAPRS
jgi:hypothetical protein